MSLPAGSPGALPDQTGEEVRLSDHKARRVVVYFYPKADTPVFAHV